MPTNPSTSINRLVLIGNGFDLAHKMKTSYGDFILWYFQKSLDIAKSSYAPSSERRNIKLFEDGLMNITINPSLQGDKPIDMELNNSREIKEFVNPAIDFYKPHLIHGNIKSDFFRSLTNDFFSKNWVDIENHYYHQLTKIINPAKSHDNPRSEVDFVKLKKLNNDFDLIKKELEIYLSTIDQPKVIDNLGQSIYEDNGVINPPYFPEETLGNVMFLNFNYTSTPEIYKKDKTDIIYIHGKLNDVKNPIIFGYGDERDGTYDILEKANNPAVFPHIKSFDYFKTNNYTRLLAFLESEYDVYIMGHSCGLSDRTLLSTIFEHENCRLIKIFFYENMARYRETTYEISRHFTSKAEMRRKVINYSDCVPMPQLTP